MLVSFSVFREEVENGIYDVNGFHPLPHPSKGIKRQTIRAQRADGRVPKVGETAHLWWKSRTQERQKLGEFPITSVESIAIWPSSQVVSYQGRQIGHQLKRDLAERDGFDDFQGLADFMLNAHGSYVLGWVIRW